MQTKNTQPVKSLFNSRHEEVIAVTDMFGHKWSVEDAISSGLLVPNIQEQPDNNNTIHSALDRKIDNDIIPSSNTKQKKCTSCNIFKSKDRFKFNYAECVMCYAKSKQKNTTNKFNSTLF